MSLRIQRMQEFLKQEIGTILLQEMSDPRLRFVSVTRVEVSKDLRFAKVHVSALESDTRLGTIMTALGHARGHIQSLVAPRLRTRFVPKLTFIFDPGLATAVRISKAIDEAVAEDEARAVAREARSADDADAEADDAHATAG